MPYDEDMVNEQRIDESLNEIKVFGISQFKKECQETEQIEDPYNVCLMSKLHEDMQTQEIEDVTTIKDVILAEHCSPRQLV